MKARSAAKGFFPENFEEERKWDLELMELVTSGRRPQNGGMVRGSFSSSSRDTNVCLS